MLNNIESFLSDAIYYLPALVIAFTIHEFAHAFVSYKLGDYKIKEDGRLTLNPIKHLDALGLMLLVIMGFGWAKPVEIHPTYYKNPVKDTVLVSLAGPLSNFVLALLAIILNSIFKDSTFSTFFMYLWFVNIGIGIFNLLPVPPLDGSNLMILFMRSDDYEDYLKNWWLGLITLVFIFYTDFMSTILNPIATFINNIIY